MMDPYGIEYRSEYHRRPAGRRALPPRAPARMWRRPWDGWGHPYRELPVRTARPRRIPPPPPPFRGRRRRPLPYDAYYRPPPHRRWRTAYDAGEAERRRDGERRRYREEEPAEEPWRERGRRFFERFREPIIGLTVAAAAAPVARSAAQAPREAAPPPRTTAQQVTGRRARTDMEEELGQRWATAEAERAREDTIQGAMARYGIPYDLAADIYDVAVDEGIEPEIAYGLVNTESSFRHRAVSSVGARGLTQVMPATARWLRPGTTNEDLFDRQVNLRLGFSYLRDLIAKYDGNIRLALLAYNRGPGTVDRVLSQGGDPDNGYADMVLSG